MSFRRGLILFFVAIVVVAAGRRRRAARRGSAEDSRTARPTRGSRRAWRPREALYDEALRAAPGRGRAGRRPARPGGCGGSTRRALESDRGRRRPRARAVASVAILAADGQLLAAGRARRRGRRPAVATSAGRDGGADRRRPRHDPERAAFLGRVSKLTAAGGAARRRREGCSLDDRPRGAADLPTPGGRRRGRRARPARRSRAAASQLDGDPRRARMVLLAPRSESGFVASEPLVAASCSVFFAVALPADPAAAAQPAAPGGAMLQAARRIGERRLRATRCRWRATTRWPGSRSSSTG